MTVSSSGPAPTISVSVTPKSRTESTSDTTRTRGYEVNDEESAGNSAPALFDTQSASFEDIDDIEMELGPKSDGSNRHRQSNLEFVKEMLIETLPTLAFSTVGLTITGEMVEVVANWKAMSRIDELFILIPVLNNMKGNLEMNLSTRLGTASYLGALDTQSSRKSIIMGNMLLLQVQALIISFIAGCFSFVISWITKKVEGKKGTDSNSMGLGRKAVFKMRFGDDSTDGDIEVKRKKKGKGGKTKKPIIGNSGLSEFIFVICTSMTAASLSALTLGSFMCTLIVLCRRFKLDPDIVAPPIAAALGDLITLFLLSLLSTVFLPLLPTLMPLLFTTILIGGTMFLAYLCFQNMHVRPLLSQGWSPLIGATVIESFSGMVLDQFVNRYEGYGLLAIVITGLPGGVGSIFVSRLSTLLHATSLGSVPGITVKGATSAQMEEYVPLNAEMSPEDLSHREETESPFEHEGSSGIALTSRGPTRGNSQINLKAVEEEDARLPLFAGTLFGITFPVQILFLLFVHFAGWVELNWTFVFVFMIMFSLSVVSSLMIAQWLTYYLWSKGLDPDLYAMPIQSALVDLIGQLCLLLSYEAAGWLGNDMLMHAHGVPIGVLSK